MCVCVCVCVFVCVTVHICGERGGFDQCKSRLQRQVFEQEQDLTVAAETDAVLRSGDSPTGNWFTEMQVTFFFFFLPQLLKS